MRHDLEGEGWGKRKGRFQSFPCGWLSNNGWNLCKQETVWWPDTASPKAKHDSRTSRRGSIIWSTPYKRVWGPGWRMGGVGAVIDRGWGCVDRGCQIAASSCQGGSAQVTRIVQLGSTVSSYLPPPTQHHHLGPRNTNVKTFSWWSSLIIVIDCTTLWSCTFQGNLWPRILWFRPLSHQQHVEIK